MKNDSGSEDEMKVSPQREVILEIERVTLMRKRTKTTVEWCRECRKETDFIPLVKVAALFGIGPEELLEFVRSNNCHFTVGRDGEIGLCLVALLSAMSKRIKAGSIKLIGEPPR
jgi:hypothetical protein